MRGPMPVHTLRSIPSGDAGVIETLKEMRSIVRAWKVAPVILQRATEIIRPCGGKDWSCQVRRLHAFVRDRVRYQLDVRDVETIRTPELTLRERVGDCDDKSVLLASMLEATGHPTRFIALGFGPPPAPYSHVLVETRIGDEWIAAETTEPWPLGQKPQGATRVLPFFV
jgi:transglutaminase-like putative cysteine protease